MQELQFEAIPSSAQALKAVKGVLNKLTPEKFERLLQQLLDAVKSVAVLRGLITLIFENAVAQVRRHHARSAASRDERCTFASSVLQGTVPSISSGSSLAVRVQLAVNLQRLSCAH